MPDIIQYESELFYSIHDKANIAKNECFFVGFVEGILANGKVDETEVEPLLAECNAICQQVRDEDAAEIVTEASAGHQYALHELLDLLKMIAEVRSKKIDISCSRSSANRLLGFCAGVNCDSIITTREAKMLYQRLNDRHDLEADPRIGALKHSLADALQDEFIAAEECVEISHLITSLVGDSYADTGIPSSEAIPVIQDLDRIEATTFSGQQVVVTGGFSFGSRREVEARLRELGAIIKKNPSQKTDIVIVGSDGSPHFTHKLHGGKLAKALSFRTKGPAPRIYVELQLREVLF